MQRMKVLAVAIVAFGVLLLGADLAYTGWNSDAKVNVEGTVVSIPWIVIDNVNSAPDCNPTIAIAVPPYTSFELYQNTLESNTNLLTLSAQPSPVGFCRGQVTQGLEAMSFGNFD